MALSTRMGSGTTSVMSAVTPFYGRGRVQRRAGQAGGAASWRRHSLPAPQKLSQNPRMDSTCPPLRVLAHFPWSMHYE